MLKPVPQKLACFTQLNFTVSLSLENGVCLRNDLLWVEWAAESY